jgi:parvulin-like peptidyl-prolyl isomerase
MPLQPARIGTARMRQWILSLTRLFNSALVATVVVASAGVSFAQTPGTAVSGGSQVTTGNDVVAVVNANPITRQELSKACVERYGADVLDNMINRHLILQACHHHGITVTETEVREEIQRIAEKFGLTMQSYLQLLQKERDIEPDQYSREIVWPMLALRRLVADKVEVTDEEFNRAFLSQFGEAVKCRMIMVGKKETADSIQQQAAANPAQFKVLAKQRSEDESSASVGGLIPPIRRYNGDSRIEEAAFALNNDQVSPVLQLGDQWIILQSVRRILASTPSPQALPSIRAQITDRIRDEKMRTAASELFGQLQQESRVEKFLGNAELSKQNPGIAAIINGQKVSVSVVGAECIKRHGLDVLEGEINRKLLTQALRRAGKTVADAEIKQEIARAAASVGYVRGDGSADVQAWMESVMRDGKTTESIYIADAVWPSVALTKLVSDQITLTDEDLQLGFESSFGPRVEILAIVLSDQRSAQKIWEMARDNPTDEFFGMLAEQYSIEPVSASNRGKVPPIRKHGGQPAIEREAFQLKPGELSGIIVTGDKHIILRCQGYTEPVVKDFEAVRTELVRDLTEKKTNIAMTRYFEQLKDSAEIDNFLAAQKAMPRVAAEPTRSRK